MAHVVCLLNIEADRATFTWSEGPASFEPYTLRGMVHKDFQEIAAEAREKLGDLVKDYLCHAQEMPQSAFALAEAGHELYQAMFQPGAEQARQARQVRKWLEQLAQQEEVDTLEIVVESPWSLPWNVIYDRQPDPAAFRSGDENPACWKPFWALRYNLAGGRKVDPLRRMPLLKDPQVLLVVDPEIRDGLPDEQQKRLTGFAETHHFKMVHSKDEFQAAIKAERPDFLYWLSHAAPDALVLAGEEISPRDIRKLLRQDDDEKFGGLAFLNACQTAERGESGSFFEAFHNVGFAGMIGTEDQTVDQFANPLGLDFLEAFLNRGEPVGSALRKLRGRVPLGLLYGTYCPPDIRVDRGHSKDSLDIRQVHTEGVALSGGPAAHETALPPLPDDPYRSLAYYDREDRALFAGRDDDIERFATYLDDASTRILVLHGESGVGKSSFLHAGVIPYLEEECLGYRFIRDREADKVAGSQGSVIFIRATNDLFGQLAQALCEFCARPYDYQTPLGDQVSADLPSVLRELIGDEVNQLLVRALLRSDPSLLGQIMAAISNRLPFTAILVIDQGEEVFTLAQTAEDQQRGRQALDMLRRTVGAAGDFKVIFCLRTEYYGRLIDRLRRGLHDPGSIREYLLTDFDEQELLDAICRPTSNARIPYTSEVPHEKYGFRYADRVAEEIARRVVRYTTQRRDSVLPLMQVICAQLYRLTRRRAEKTITLADLEKLGGIEGGMRNHVDGLLAELLKASPQDKRPLQKLFTQLYLKQPDGTLTTALSAEDDVQKLWTGRMPFAELLGSSCQLRLLKVNSLRIGMEEERRYVSLGHDALAKIAADWDQQLSHGARMRRMAAVVSAVSAVAVVMAVMALFAFQAKQTADVERDRAEQARKTADVERDRAEQAQGRAVAAQQEALDANIFSLQKVNVESLKEIIHKLNDLDDKQELIDLLSEKLQSPPPQERPGDELTPEQSELQRRRELELARMRFSLLVLKKDPTQLPPMLGCTLDPHVAYDEFSVWFDHITEDPDEFPSPTEFPFQDLWKELNDSLVTAQVEQSRLEAVRKLYERFRTQYPSDKLTNKLQDQLNELSKTKSKLEGSLQDALQSVGRIAAFLAKFDAESDNWTKKQVEDLLDRLTQQEPDEFNKWGPRLQPVSRLLEPVLLQIYDRESSSKQARNEPTGESEHTKTWRLENVQKLLFFIGVPLPDQSDRPTTAEIATSIEGMVWIKGEEKQMSGFYIGKYEVTQQQYQIVMNKNPSQGRNPNGPVTNVKWQDAENFCNKLNELKTSPVLPFRKSQYPLIGLRLGKLPDGFVYKLPTEAQWQYACSDGGKQMRYTVEQLNKVAYCQSNLKGLGGFREGPTDVGSKDPTAFGLYDMLGNVSEWCSGDSGDTVIRGGSYFDDDQTCQPGFRQPLDPTTTADRFGFRIVAVKEGKK